jgi:competence protein ComEC
MKFAKCLVLAAFAICCTSLFAAGKLELYFINPEDGNAVLMVSPSGESMLIDSAVPMEKSATRILDAMRAAGVKQIDYLVTSHYDNDHFGTVKMLAEKVPILNFVDHGPPLHPDSSNKNPVFINYAKEREKGKHIVPESGEGIGMKGVDVRVVTNQGRVLQEPLAGLGISTAPNPACWMTHLQDENHDEDSQSLGLFITFGKFRFIDLGDLTWNVSYRLFCPFNKVGPVDLYLITHHGLSLDKEAVGELSSVTCCNPAEVYGLHPRVAILSSGEDYKIRISTPEGWQTVRHSAGLEDIWQIHYQAQGGMDNNAPEPFVACYNTVDCQGGDWIKVTAAEDGSFTVTNKRNGFTKTYAARKDGR